MRALAGSLGTHQPMVAKGRDLHRVELRRLAWALGHDRDFWEPHVRIETDQRHFSLVYDNPHLQVWVICWANDQDTGLHDHDISSGAVHVCRGDVIEDRLEYRDGVVRLASVDRLRGSTFDFDASHVHCVRHAPHSPPAVSIHVYSPRLVLMGYYQVDSDGLLRRLSVSCAEEATAA